MVGREERGNQKWFPLFFYFYFHHGLPSGKPFPPTTPQPYQVIGKDVRRVYTGNLW
jgi:hypothetical protein